MRLMCEIGRVRRIMRLGGLCGRVFMDLNEPKSAHELEALFKNFDTDQSGEISFVEFCDGVRSYIGKKKANESAAVDRTSSRVEEESKEDDGDESEEEECPDEFAQEKFKTIEEQQAAIKRSSPSSSLDS